LSLPLFLFNGTSVWCCPTTNYTRYNAIARINGRVVVPAELPEMSTHRFPRERRITFPPPLPSSLTVSIWDPLRSFLALAKSVRFMWKRPLRFWPNVSVTIFPSFTWTTCSWRRYCLPWRSWYLPALSLVLVDLDLHGFTCSDQPLTVILKLVVSVDIFVLLAIRVNV